MLNKTATALNEYALTLPPCSARAQCYTISGYKLVDGETIAHRIARDHCSTGDAMRAMMLVVEAGVATHESENPSCYGVFTFEDGSTFK